MSEEPSYPVVERDKVDTQYVAGTGTTRCPHCDTTLPVTHNAQSTDKAYCETCDIEFNRPRNPVYTDDIETKQASGLEGKKLHVPITTTSAEDKDGYVEYHCPACSEKWEDEDIAHELTIPDGEFTPVDTGLSSHEMICLNCPCGNGFHANLDIDEEVACDDCGRVHELSLTSGKDLP